MARRDAPLAKHNRGVAGHESVRIPSGPSAEPVMNERRARAFFAVTSVVVGFALILQLVVSITAQPAAGSFASTPERVVNLFSFFTVLSNITVAVATGLLAIRLDRRSALFRTPRLDG